MNNNPELKVLKMNRKIINLENEISEKRNFSWTLGQILKHSNNIQNITKYMNNIIDMQIGVLGLQAVTIYLENNGKKYKFSINNKKDNKFYKNTISFFPRGIENLKETLVKNQNGKISTLITPIENFLKNEISGFIVATQDAHDFFDETRIMFYENLAIIIMNSITNFNLYKKVQRISTIDMLTNCYNRRFFDDFKEKYKDSKNVSMIIFDIDKFKDINDTYGHNVGDIVLKTISREAIELFNKYDGKVVRFGGDEFVIVLEKTLEETIKIAEKYKRILSEVKYKEIDGKQPTASFGITSYPERIECFDDLLLFADKSLYKAKEEGRNRIVTY